MCIFEEGRIFPDSEKLATLFARHGYELLDVSPTGHGQKMGWATFDDMDGAREFVFGRLYFFVPLRVPGESRRETYSKLMDLGPCLRIDKPDDGRWKSLHIRTNTHAVFSRLGFARIGLVAMSAAEGNFDSDIVIIRYGYALDTFERYFSVLSTNAYTLMVETNRQ